MQSNTSKKSHLQQKIYIANECETMPERMERVNGIAREFGDMHESCQMSVCIPAYREGSLIRNTLQNYTIYQTEIDGTRLSPEVFEINILINRPNDDSKRDTFMFDEIQKFQSEYPEYHINIAEILYDFPKKAIIGTIFKDIVDAVIVRNLSRSASLDTKSRLILRTAGADVEALNPLLLSRTLTIFSNTNIVAHRGETRLPPQLLQSFPLLHVMQTFAVFLLRQYRGDKTTNGPFSYTAESYAAVNGFHPEMTLGEEVDLAKRIFLYAEESQGQLSFLCDEIKDVLNNPRRQVHALFRGMGMAGRYQEFGTSINEDKVHSMSTSWRTLCPKTLPLSCKLTPENLSREMSGYYRTYLRIAKKNNVPLERIDALFRRGFELCGITEYEAHKSSFMYDNHIEIQDIEMLVKHMGAQTFSWSENFSQYCQKTTSH